MAQVLREIRKEEGLLSKHVFNYGGATINALIELLERLSKGEGLKTLAGNFLILLVGTRGFEPPTPWTPSRCATRLRYVPIS